MLDPEKNPTFNLKLTGRVNIPEALQIGQNYHVSIKGTITSETTSDDFAGSFEKDFKFVPVNVEILDDLGKSIKAKDKRRISQKIRGAIFYCHQELGSELSEEEFYEQQGNKIVKYMPTVLEVLKEYE